MNHIPLPFLILSNEGHIIGINEDSSANFEFKKNTENNFLFGEALRCINAQGDTKCGQGANCGKCIFRNTMNECIKTKKNVYNRTGLFVMEDKGSRHTRSLIISADYLESGNENRIMLAITDNTNPKKLEMELEQKQNECKNILQAAKFCYALHEVICDEEGRILDLRYLDANTEFEKLINLDLKEIIGKSVSELFPDRQLTRIRRLGQVALTGKSAHYVEFTKKFNNRYFDITAYSPAIGQVAVLAVDITEIKLTEAKLIESERRFRDTLDNIQKIAVSIDSEGSITYCNDFLLTVTGWKREEILGQNWFSLFVPPDESSLRQKEFKNLKTSKKNSHNVGDIITKSGKRITLKWDDIVLMDPEEKVTGVNAIGEDITILLKTEKLEREKRILTEALNSTAEALNSTLELTEVMERILTSVGTIISYDTVAIFLIKDSFTFTKYYRGFNKFGLDDFISQLRFPLLNVPSFRNVMETGTELIIEDTYNSPYWENLKETVMFNSAMVSPIIIKGVIEGFIVLQSLKKNTYSKENAAIIKSFSQQAASAINNARLFEENEHLSLTDQLTGLYNRRGLLTFGKREIARIIRNRQSVSLLFLDVDFFKQFNDKYSYEVGDKVLKTLAQCLQNNIREIDLISRYGGEEFVILLSEINTEEALNSAERIRTLIENTSLHTDSEDLSITVSIGVTGYDFKKDEEYMDSEYSETMLKRLIKKGGDYLHTAKKNGRNCVASFNSKPGSFLS